MQREIKFRSWNPHSKKMTYVPDGGFLHLGEGGFLEQLTWYVSEKTGNGGYTSCAYSDASTLMQYTGLRDKNGKEIYEGDILNWDTTGSGDEDIVDKVIWDEEMARFGWGDDGMFFNEEMEIIGNIYENPDLLK